MFSIYVKSVVVCSGEKREDSSRRRHALVSWSLETFVAVFPWRSLTPVPNSNSHRTSSKNRKRNWKQKKREPLAAAAAAAAASAPTRSPHKRYRNSSGATVGVAPPRDLAWRCASFEPLVAHVCAVLGGKWKGAVKAICWRMAAEGHDLHASFLWGSKSSRKAAVYEAVGSLG